MAMKMNMCMRSSFVFISIMMLLSGLPVTDVTDSAEAQTVSPEITVELSETILLVDVSPTGTGIAQTLAILKNDSPHQVSATIDVDIEGYLSSPNSVSISMPPGSERIYPVTIAAELRSAYKVEGGIVRVTVKSVNFIPLDDFFIHEASFVVRTGEYVRLVLDTDMPMVKQWPGKTTKVKVNILNEGNIADEVRLEVSNREDLYKEGFSIALESSGSLLIQPRDSERMTVHVTTPQSIWKNEYYTVDIRVYLAYETNQRFDYSVTFWVYGVYVSGFDPVPAVIAMFVVAAFIAKRKD